jgi:predicted enzyme related to lactoylglutathione lyase
MNPVVHFELPAEDRQRMSDFYNKAFGWKTQMLGEEMGNYTLVTTCEVGENGFPKNPGMINGGFYPKNPAAQYQTINLVLSVDDIHVSIQKAVDAGGSVFGEIQEIPGYGLYVSIIDTEGNRISLMQPLGM